MLINCEKYLIKLFYNNDKKAIAFWDDQFLAIHLQYYNSLLMMFSFALK